MDESLAMFIVAAVIIAAVVGKMLLNKGIDAAATTLNKKVLFKSEYKEQQQMVATQLIFETTANNIDIWRELASHLALQETLPIVGTITYAASVNPDFVVYAYGNKLRPRAFVMSVKLTQNGAITEGKFKFESWLESDGIMNLFDVMKKHKNQVINAFHAADSNVKIAEVQN